jgi:basic amino acid/polyamine antiporter, APA family
VPYVFSSLALFMTAETGARQRLTRGSAAVAAAAFVYSLFAIGGAGSETVYWGFLLMVVGLPVYVWVVRRRVPAAVATPATPV